MKITKKDIAKLVFEISENIICYADCEGNANLEYKDYDFSNHYKNLKEMLNDTGYMSGGNKLLIEDIYNFIKNLNKIEKT